MDIDVLIKGLNEIGDAMDPMVSMTGKLDDTYRDLRKVIKILSADKDFVMLDRLKVLVDDDDEDVDGGMPLKAAILSLEKEEDTDPLGVITEIYSRVYGLIVALEEYKKYIK